MSVTGKINVDFQVLKTYDPKTLLIADTSDWKHIEGKTSVIEITMPGARIARQLFFDKGKVNVFNSSILGITPKACSVAELKELPDGIYTIKVKGSPDTFNKERQYLRTERLQLQVDKIYLTLGVDFESDKADLREAVYKIDLMIKAAESSIRLGDVGKASKFFDEAKKLLRDFTECRDC